jgi:AAA domain-containing protein
VRPVITEVADEIWYTWPDVALKLAFSKLRETESGAVRGMVEVTNGTGRHVWWGQVSLTTAADRKTLTSKLAKAADHPENNWEQDVDRLFQDVYQRYTKVPEPSEIVGAEDTRLDARFLIDPLLPDGQISLLLADQGSTKSFLMLYLAVCVALGRASVLGQPCRSGPVVIFDWEVDEEVASRRVSWICRGMDVGVPHGLHYLNMSTRGRLFDRIRDMRYIVGRVKPALVLIDSLTFAVGGDLNSAEYAAPTMTAVGSLGEGVTKLASAHPNKASRSAGADDVSVIGSALFEYRARAIWHMKREQPRASRFGVSLTPRKPFDGPPLPPLTYRLVFDNIKHAVHFEPLRLADAPGLEATTLTNAERIRKVLAKEGALGAAAIADLAGIKADVVAMECRRMPDVFPVMRGGGRGNTTTWGLGEPNATADTPPWWSGDKPDQD